MLSVLTLLSLPTHNTTLILCSGGISELFVNVPAYGIAYSRAPKNMKGLVTALNLFSTGIAYALGLAFGGLITDPYLTVGYIIVQIPSFRYVATLAPFW